MNTMKNKRRGTTLIELLVCIVILSILASASILLFRGFEKEKTNYELEISNANVETARIYFVQMTGREPEKGELLDKNFLIPSKK